MSLSVNIEQQEDVAVVRLTGRIEPLNFPNLATALNQLLQAGRCRIVLDCTRLDYLNTAEVPLLLEFETAAQASGGEIAWVGLSDEIDQVIHLLDGHHPRRTFAQVERAVRELRQVEKAHH